MDNNTSLEALNSIAKSLQDISLTLAIGLSFIAIVIVFRK